MSDPPKRTKQTLRVLEEFLVDPTQEIHGFDLIDRANVRSGTLYPLLIRLEGLAWLESRWEESDRPGPRKRMYRLTAEGEPVARQFVASAAKTSPSNHSAPGRRRLGEATA
jgi:PadR family transcriptional regulator PadR